MSKDVAKTQELEHNGKAYAVDVLKNSQWRKIKILDAIGILDLIPANGEKLELYQGCDRLAKFTQKSWNYIKVAIALLSLLKMSSIGAMRLKTFLA